MYRSLVAISLAVVLLAANTACNTTHAQDPMPRIQQKAELARQGVIERKQAGQDVQPLLDLMAKVQPALRAGKPNEAEAALDQVLAALKGGATQSSAPSGAAQSSASAWQSTAIEGDPDGVGIYDPSIEYTRDGSVGWMAYLSIHGPVKFGTRRYVGPYHDILLARSDDHGKSWRYVGRILQSTDGSVNDKGRSLTGVWRYEVPSLVYDPDHSGHEWKLFTHKYFWNEQNDRMPAYGWITYQDAPSPTGPWSKEVALFGAGRFPEPPYDTSVRLNNLDRSLNDILVYTEPGTLYRDHTLYVSMSGVIQTGPDRIVLFASDDHGRTWRFVNTLATRREAAQLGFKALDGSALVEVRGQVYLFASPMSSRAAHDGEVVIPFEDIAKGTLRKDASGKLAVVKRIEPEKASLTPMGAGPGDYDQHNTAGGIVMPLLDGRLVQSHKTDKVFVIMNTGQRVAD